jgi:hypothetical protein
MRSKGREVKEQRVLLGHAARVCSALYMCGVCADNRSVRSCDFMHGVNMQGRTCMGVVRT